MPSRPHLNRPVLLAGILLLAATSRAGDWEPCAPLPAPKSENFAVTWNGEVYVVGGSPWVNGNDQDGTVWRLSDGAWIAVAPLDGMGPTVGQGGGVDALDRIVVFGGVVTPSGDLGEPRLYDPLQGCYDTPTDASIFHPALNFGLATDAQGRIYRLGGGCDVCNNNTGICSRYDGTTDSWQQVAWLPYSRSSIASCYDGRGHIWGFGGYTSFGLPRLVDTIRYDLATNTWSTLGSLFLPVGTSDAKAALGADGLVYCIGGRTGATAAGTPTATVYVLDPGAADPHLVPGPALQVARYDFALALGADGWLYVIGGRTADGPTTSVERLYTGACPEAVALSPAQLAAAGQQVTLHASASGGAPLELRWERDGVPLSDGPTGHGSTLAGATTDTLVIGAVAPQDAGAYRLVAGNPCGSASSTDILLTVDSAWLDLGQAKPGSAGTSHLAGSGLLTAGSANLLELAGALPGAPVTLVFGLAPLNAPFKGGVLVTAPVLLVALAADASGGLALPFAWPAGVAAGTDLYFQAWLQDAGATHGLSASNGLRGTSG